MTQDDFIKITLKAENAHSDTRKKNDQRESLIQCEYVEKVWTNETVREGEQEAQVMKEIARLGESLVNWLKRSSRLNQ